MTPAELATENEALHALLADACTVLGQIVSDPSAGPRADSRVVLKRAQVRARRCLERVRNGEAA